MRLVTWNCFRGDALARAGDVADLGADVLVLQECSRPAAADSGALVWFGANPRHGAAVLARTPYRIRLGPASPEAGGSAFPVEVTGPAGAFHLLAVWAKPAPTYVGSVWAALDAYGPWLAGAPAVVAGDFNSHPCWDRSARRNHTRLAGRLREEFGLVSAWHAVTAGSAPEPATHFHRWRNDRGFHIDYCFVPASWAAAGLVAAVPDWPVRARGSDHRPLVVQVGVGAANARSGA